MVLKYNKKMGRPRIKGYVLVKATKNPRIAKDYATKLLDKYPTKYVTYDFKEDKRGFILVYMMKHWGGYF